MAFGDGSLCVTGNRCPRGGAISWDELVREVPAAEELVRRVLRGQAPARRAIDSVPNLFVDREKLLFESYPTVPVCGGRDVTIGIPRVLEFWDTMPFWSTFFSTLGFKVRVGTQHQGDVRARSGAVHSTPCASRPSLSTGTCANLVDAGVDRIFMPIITTVPTENTASTSEWMCAVVKGYPNVMRNSDNPESVSAFRSIRRCSTGTTRATETASSRRGARRPSISMPTWLPRRPSRPDRAQETFENQLQLRGRQVLETWREDGGYAVVIASARTTTTAGQPRAAQALL